MTNNVEQLKISCNGETFTRGTYNGINVIIRDKDGFINATTMCNQFGKRFRKINENHAWQAYLAAFRREYYARPGMDGQEIDPTYQLNKGISTKMNELRGTYVDPRLINYIAIWASPEYAVTVGKIMDSINDRVHQQLQEENKTDTPENAKPVFTQIVTTLIDEANRRGQAAYESQHCWGIRDHSTAADDDIYIKAYERDRLKQQQERLKFLRDEQ